MVEPGLHAFPRSSSPPRSEEDLVALIAEIVGDAIAVRLQRLDLLVVRLDRLLAGAEMRERITLGLRLSWRRIAIRGPTALRGASIAPAGPSVTGRRLGIGE